MRKWIRTKILYLRFIKLCMLAIYAVLVSTWHSRFHKTYVYRVKLSSSDFWLRGYFLLFLFKLVVIRPLYFLRVFHRDFFNKNFTKHDWIIADFGGFPDSISTIFGGIVFLAWVCEKMKINIKLVRTSCVILEQFENNTLINTTNAPQLKSNFPYKPFIVGYALTGWEKHFILSEYGHQVLSKLSIKKELQEIADQWFDTHIKGCQVAVHYRGTDAAAGEEISLDRYPIKPEHYINYLREVVSDKNRIFVASDQKQFVDQMHEAFPGKVFARDIQRSYDNRSLHRDPQYKGEQQIKNALIDLLILAKTKLIYTTGSGFVYATRFFNPKIKIITLDGKREFRDKNVRPVSRDDLYNKFYLPYLEKNKVSPQ